ncbi:MAG: 2-oxoacid:acceptor oxidoreductase subunit alpha [Candidatus Hodarchaeota archaeon]
MKDYSLVISGAAGQGIATMGELLLKILQDEGYFVFAAQEFMSRIRGGSNSTEIRISSKPVHAFVDRIDILVPLTKLSMIKLADRLDDGTLIIGERSKIGDDARLHDVDLTGIATKIGGKIYSNIVAVGVIAGLFNVEMHVLERSLKKYFKGKNDEIIENNVEAARIGHEIGVKMADDGVLKVELDKNSAVKDHLVLNGAQAVSIGALSGGCNFISSYPMSPATGVLVFLSKQSNSFDIIAEQAEDEIAAINMAIGAWYAGGRAMVTTSGGGFALMEEGMSLSGITETPVVLHLGQRPGPGTGLPTRTEQGDLNLVLYSGHGDFPRIIFTPGTIEDAFLLAAKAFNMADKHQVPVIILTDQYILDSYHTASKLDLTSIQNESHVITTSKDYVRYELTGDGISPRGIPGRGKGLVCCDSDEHDESGHITEDFNVRIQMVDKRMSKLDLMKEDAVPPDLIGSEDYENLVIGWGTTFHAIKEALEEINDPNTSFLHVKQVYPLDPGMKDYLDGAERIILVENNYGGQLGQLMKLEFGMEVDHKLLKYNGEPFSVEQLVHDLREVI